MKKTQPLSINRSYVLTAVIAAAFILFMIASHEQSAREDDFNQDNLGTCQMPDNALNNSPSSASTFPLNLFDTRGFPPRWQCGTWSHELGLTHIISDLVIFLAYAAIPIALMYFIRKKKDIPFTKLFVMFSLFIFSCGTVHLIEAIIFWEPIYRISAAAKAFTAIVSVATVVVLIKALPFALTLPGLKKINRKLLLEIDSRKNTEKQLIIHTNKLEKAKDQLKQINDELEQFAFIASHDLKEPLRKISYYTKVIWEENKKNPISEKQMKAMSRVDRSTNRMEQLIDKLLQYSRSGHDEHEIGKTDLNKVWKDAFELFAEQIETENARIKTENIPLVIGNHLMLTQVFENLISNSLKYKDPNRNPEITLSILSTNNKTLTLLYKDNGIGFDDKHSHEIFLPLKRLHSQDEVQGTGMGLAICKKILRAHNGDINAFCKKADTGATFIIELPLHMGIQINKS